MSRRSRSFNAFEQATTAAIDDAVTSIPLDSVTNLTPPGYLVIDPDNPLLREYIFYTEINALVLDNVSRGLAGSAGGLAQEHAAGARVRAVSVHQWLDDLFDDIEDLEDGTAVIPTYLAIGGGNAMAANLDMGGGGFRVIDMGNGIADQDATTLKQVTESDLLLLDLAGTRAMTGALDMGTQLINNVVDPVDPQDAATKQYLDDTFIPLAGTNSTGQFMPLNARLEWVDATNRILFDGAGTFALYKDDLLRFTASSTSTRLLSPDGVEKIAVSDAGNIDMANAVAVFSPVNARDSLLTSEQLALGRGDTGTSIVAFHIDNSGTNFARIQAETGLFTMRVNLGAQIELTTTTIDIGLGTADKVNIATNFFRLTSDVTDVRFQGVGGFASTINAPNMWIDPANGLIRISTFH